MDLANINKTMSSREIAELTGKLHKNVLTDIDILNKHYAEMTMAEIPAMNYKADNGQYYREFNLTKIQTLDLITGYSIPLRIKINRRWEQLEQQHLIGTSSLLQLTRQLQQERQELHDDMKQIEARADKLEIIEEFLCKTMGASGFEINTQPSPWHELFIKEYGHLVLDHIENNIDEWIEQRQIPVSEFNKKYGIKGLGVRPYNRAIHQYCVNTNVKFEPHKVIRNRNEGLVRVRVFERM